MILAITPQQARVVNNCACYFTTSRLTDAGLFWGRVKGHPFAANDDTWLPADWPFGDFK